RGINPSHRSTQINTDLKNSWLPNRWLLPVRSPTSDLWLLLQNGLMKLMPIVKIVQVHRVAWSGSVIGDAARTQNAITLLIVVIIAAHRGVMLLDRLLI